MTFTNTFVNIININSNIYSKQTKGEDKPMKTTNKIYGYVRVSTKEQNEARQEQAILEQFPGAIILKDKQTGTNTDRPNLQLLLQIIGKGDLVVIKSLDRLSRSYKDTKDLWDKLTETGADILVLDMPMLDTRQHKELLGTFISDLILSVLGYVAQQETEFRKQRQTEGINVMPLDEEGKKISAKTGRRTGRPKAKYPKDWKEVYSQWKQGEVTATKAMEKLDLKRNTFYKLVKEYEEKGLSK